MNQILSSVALILITALPAMGQSILHDPPTTQDNPLAKLWTGVPEEVMTHGEWSFAYGLGYIGNTTVQNYIEARFPRLRGPGGGLTHNLTVNYRLDQHHWRVGDVLLQPSVEVPFMLTLVDPNQGPITTDINLGMVLRWRDFPWNKYIYTSLAVGGGFSYAFDNWRADYQRHPDDPKRSNFKFWLPIELTFALPKHPRHQLFLFIDHQSGGMIVDKGGVDAWGFGYRFLY